jgi:glucokinase
MYVEPSNTELTEKLAAKVLANGGVYLGGGISPRIYLR